MAVRGVSEAVIRFTASVYKVQTLATDSGVRVTLDLPESAIPQMAMLAECKRDGIPLLFEAKVDESFTKLDDETEKRAEARNSRVGRRRA